MGKKFCNFVFLPQKIGASLPMISVKYLTVSETDQIQLWLLNLRYSKFNFRNILIRYSTALSLLYNAI